MGAQRDDSDSLRLKIESMKNWLVCARVFYLFKCQALRQKFHEHMRALRMTLDSNQELSERLVQAAQQERTTSQAFKATAREVSRAEHQIEGLCAEVEVNTERRHRLQNWRKNKSKQLAHVSQTVKDHERLGTVDVEGMLQDIQEKAERVRHLEQRRHEESKALSAAACNSKAKTDEVRIALQQQRLLKDQTHGELQQLRKEVERGGPSNEERLQLWRGRALAARQRLEGMQEENQRLRQLHLVRGLAMPDSTMVR